MGSRGSLTLAPAFAAKHDLAAKLSAKNEAITGAGMAGPMRSLLARGKMLKLGTVEVPYPVIAIPRDTEVAIAESEIAGNVGFGILRQFAVTYDLPNEPSTSSAISTSARPDIADRGGLWLERGPTAIRSSTSWPRTGRAGGSQGRRRDRRDQRPRMVGVFTAGTARRVRGPARLARPPQDGSGGRCHAGAARPRLTAAVRASLCAPPDPAAAIGRARRAPRVRRAGKRRAARTSSGRAAQGEPARGTAPRAAATLPGRARSGCAACPDG